MIICSCAVISDKDVEAALIEIMRAPEALLPTPGVVYRQLGKRLECCGCVSLTIATIYEKLSELEASGVVCPYRSAAARARIVRLKTRGEAAKSAPVPVYWDACDVPLIAAE